MRKNNLFFREKIAAPKEKRNKKKNSH